MELHIGKSGWALLITFALMAGLVGARLYNVDISDSTSDIIDTEARDADMSSETYIGNIIEGKVTGEALQTASRELLTAYRDVERTGDIAKINEGTAALRRIVPTVEVN